MKRSKRMKRILILLLALLLTLSTVFAASCKKGENTDETGGSVSTGGVNDGALPAPEVKDYGGRVMNILTLEGSSLLEGVDGDSEAIAQALVERTTYIETTYNIDMQLATVTDGQDYIAFQNSYLGGLREYDMIVPHPTKYLAAMMSSGMMQDLNDVAHIDTSKPWWNQSEVENYTIKGKLFFGVSDFNLNKRGFSVMVLNKEMYSNMFDEDIYKLVDDGKWTMDKMYELIMSAYDPDQEIYGYALNTGGVYGFYYGAGETLLKRNDDGDLYLKFDVDKTSLIAQKTYQIVIGEQTLQDAWYNSTFQTCDAWRSFSGGRTLLMGIDIGAFGHLLREIDFETAYLPSPKLNEEQTTYRAVCGAGFVGIPNDAKDIEFSALILEALNHHSYYNFRPAYFDTYMSYVVSKNENDYKILEMVLDNTVYDLGFTLDSAGLTSGLALGMFKTVIIDGLSYNVASYIEENEDAGNNAFQNIIKDIY